MPVTALGRGAANTCRRHHAGGTSGHAERRAADPEDHAASPLSPGAGVVQALSPSARCGSARPGRCRARRRAADPPAVPVLKLRQWPDGFRGDGYGGDGPAAVIAGRAAGWETVALRPQGQEGGRGVPASPQQGGCSSPIRFVRAQTSPGMCQTGLPPARGSPCVCAATNRMDCASIRMDGMSLEWSKVDEVLFATAISGRNGARYQLIAEQLPDTDGVGLVRLAPG
jgi:hypothetical protein